MRAPLWSIPISSRPRHLSIAHALAFTVVFNALIIVIFLLLVALYPLRLVPNCPRARVWHQRVGKSLFGKLLVVVSRTFFGQLEFVVSSSDSDSPRDVDWVKRDTNGNVVRVEVPKNSVWISNHQTLADWLFLWQFFYLTDSSASLYIALKSSLRSIPVIGTACDWFGFAFLERNWAKDKLSFDRQLHEMARDCTAGGGNLDFLLFPEGTIVTANTRGISSRYAAKTGLQDFQHCLVPRSTGLFFALRQLAVRVPSLQLTDLTVGYPLPRRSPDSTSPTASRSPLYPSEYYSLPSVFLHRVPPPELHFHLRHYALGDVPLGDLGPLKARLAARDGRLRAEEIDEGTEEERRAFDAWLVARWREKDDLLKRFNETGSFVVASTATAAAADDDDEDEEVEGEVRWRPRLKNPVRETLEVTAFGFPSLIAAAWGAPAIWHASKALVGMGLAAIAGRSHAVKGGGTLKEAGSSCGCGKMAGGDLGGIERIEL
ncbi:hypothetical protein JCM11491_001887 [Sporobolomyces phaffii]